MHKLERYGVAALVFLLMAVLAVSLWRGSNPAPAEPLVETKAAAQPLRGGTAMNTPTRPEMSRTQTLPLHRASATQPESVRRSTGESEAGRQRQRERNLAADRRSSSATSQPAQLASSNSSSGGSADSGAQAEPMAYRQAASVQESGVRAEPAVMKPEESRSSTYVIRSGDTLSTIAARLLGDEGRWAEIARANPELDPKRLPVGKTIRVPAQGSVESATVAEAALRTSPAKAPPRKEREQPRAGGSYVVRAGDSLSMIAANVLGDGSRWREIRDLNPGVDPSRLSVGAQLALPRDAKTVASVSTSSSGPASSRSSGPRVR